MTWYWGASMSHHYLRHRRWRRLCFHPFLFVCYASCWHNGESGGLGIVGSRFQIPLGSWINTRWGWLCLSSFQGRQNECEHAGLLCRSGDPSRIVPNSPGDCSGSTNGLHRVWSQWIDGSFDCVQDISKSCGRILMTHWVCDEEESIKFWWRSESGYENYLIFKWFFTIERKGQIRYCTVLTWYFKNVMGPIYRVD